MGVNKNIITHTHTHHRHRVDAIRLILSYTTESACYLDTETVDTVSKCPSFLAGRIYFSATHSKKIDGKK